jgi:cytochrome c oxidase subunit 1
MSGVDYLAARGSDELQYFITIAAMILVTAQCIFLVNFLWSLFAGKKPANDNPWESTSLEWMLPSPPPHDNFAGRIPVVVRGPYEYSVPGRAKDFSMQHEPDSAGAAE